MNRTAPNFELPDQDGVTRKLSDYKGRWLVLFFYPRDNSLNCVREVCSFRNELAIIGQFGNASIIGVNKESVSRHKKFSDEQNLNFPLLSDETREVTKAYGAWRNGSAQIYDKIFATRRNTYIINPDGRIVKEYLGVSPKNHVTQIIKDLHAMQDLVVKPKSLKLAVE